MTLDTCLWFQYEEFRWGQGRGLLIPVKITPPDEKQANKGANGDNLSGGGPRLIVLGSFFTECCRRVGEGLCISFFKILSRLPDSPWLCLLIIYFFVSLNLLVAPENTVNPKLRT